MLGNKIFWECVGMINFGMAWNELDLNYDKFILWILMYRFDLRLTYQSCTESQISIKPVGMDVFCFFTGVYCKK